MIFFLHENLNLKKCRGLTWGQWFICQIIWKSRKSRETFPLKFCTNLLSSKDENIACFIFSPGKCTFQRQVYNSPGIYNVCVRGSSCNSHLIGLTFATVLSLPTYLHPLPYGRMGLQRLDGGRKEERMRQNTREWHELPYTEIVKSGTVRLASGVTMQPHYL